MEKQLQKALRDTTQDVPQDVLNDNTVEVDLTKGLQGLTLKEDTDMQDSADAQVTLLEVLENKSKMEEEEDETSKPSYEMTKQELQL